MRKNIEIAPDFGRRMQSYLGRRFTKKHGYPKSALEIKIDSSSLFDFFTRVRETISEWRDTLEETEFCEQLQNLDTALKAYLNIRDFPSQWVETDIGCVSKDAITTAIFIGHDTNLQFYQEIYSLMPKKTLTIDLTKILEDCFEYNRAPPPYNTFPIEDPGNPEKTYVLDLSERSINKIPSQYEEST